MMTSSGRRSWGRRSGSPHQSFNTRQGCRGRGDASVTTAALPPDVTTIAEVANLFDNPLENALGGNKDGDLPAWFPFASFVAYIWITSEVRKIRQEQERKAMAKAAEAASTAAQDKFNSIPKDAWAKLVACLVIDGLGDSSFLLPGLGEFSDGVYAPLEAFLLGQLFQSNAISSIGFLEEALPFTDVLPTATLAWFVENFFSDTVMGKVLGLQPKDAAEK